MGTGRHLWDFHTVPQSSDAFGADTWLNESWRYSGNTGVWTMLSADLELKDIPVIMVSMVDDRSQGYTLGATDYLTKPVDIDQLERALEGAGEVDETAPESGG